MEKERTYTITETNTGRVSVWDVEEGFDFEHTSVFEAKKLIAKQLHIPLNEIYVNPGDTKKYSMEKLMLKK